MSQAREYTRDEMRDEFIEHVRNMVDYWAGDQIREKQSTRERLSGLAFSILVAIDGCAGSLPAYTMVPSPHPDDKQYHQDQDENWYPDCPEMPNDISGGLHEILYKDWK